MQNNMQKEVLKDRLKSFAWRLGGMIVVALLEFIASNLGLFGLSGEVTVVLGLVMGEITKYLNVNLPELRRLQK